MLEKKFSYKPIYIVLLFIFIWSILFYLINITRYNCYNSAMYDFGNMLQGFYSLIQGRLLENSACGKILSRMTVHFEPMYLLLFPFFLLLGAGATALIIIQTVLIAFSGLGIFYIANEKFKDPILSFVLFLSYLFHPIILQANNCYFHGDTISLFFSVWMIYFFIKENNKFYFIFLLGFLSCKEYLGLYVILFSLLYIKNKSIRNISIFISILWILSFYFLIKPFMQYIYNIQNFHIEIALLLTQNNSFSELFSLWIKTPFEVIKKAILYFDIKIFFAIYLPILFIPFFFLRSFIFNIFFLLLFIFLGIFNMPMSRRLVSLIPFIYLSFFFDCNIFKEKRKIFIIMILFYSLTATIIYSPIRYYIHSFDFNFKKDMHDIILDKAIKIIPKNSSILASNYIGVQFFKHKKVCVFDAMSFYEKKYDYVILDLFLGSSTYEKKEILKILNNKHYKIIFNLDGIMILKYIKKN